MKDQICAVDQLTRAALEHAVAQRIYRFAQLNDDHAHDALADMFTIDGRFARPTAPDTPIIGREAIRAFFRDRAKRTTRHVITNVVVDLLDGSTARARSYVTLYSGDAGKNVLLGEFADELTQLASGEWLFRTRLGSISF